MKIQDSVYLFPVILAAILSVALVVYLGQPIGVDVVFHMRIAEAWARGELGMFSALPMAINHIPYPPLLHFLLVPAIWLGIKTTFTLELQALLYPLALASAMFFAWKRYGKMSGLVVGLILLGSFAWTDRVIQVNPQALDFVLLPIVFFLFTEAKPFSGLFKGVNYTTVADWLGVVYASLMVYNHGVVAFAALGGVLLWKLWRKDWKPVLAVVLIALPILIVQAYHAVPAWGGMTAGFETDQEAAFWASPLAFSIVYMRTALVGVGALLYLDFRLLARRLSGTRQIIVWDDVGLWVDSRAETQKLFKKKIEEKSLLPLYVLTLFSMSVMFVPWADRFLQYSTIPLAFIFVDVLKRVKNRDKYVWSISLLLPLALLLYISLWLVLFANGFYTSPL